MKKRILIIIIVIIIIFLAGFIGIKQWIKSINDDLNNIEINEVDLNNVEDGIYEGSYNTMPVSVTVKVTVTSHKITDIEILKHNNGQGEAAEAIIDDVIKEQSLDVDFISGATYSSKVILKAIDNALTNSENNK